MSKKKKHSKGVLKPFLKMHVSSKKKFILSLFIGEEKACDVVRKKTKVELAEIPKVTIKDLDAVVLDDSVDIKLVRPYFTENAWERVCKLVGRKRKRPEWKCSLCEHSLDGECISCDKCLQWQHLSCADLNCKPKAPFWYCKKCKEYAKLGKNIQL